MIFVRELRNIRVIAQVAVALAAWLAASLCACAQEATVVTLGMPQELPSKLAIPIQLPSPPSRTLVIDLPAPPARPKTDIDDSRPIHESESLTLPGPLVIYGATPFATERLTVAQTIGAQQSLAELALPPSLSLPDGNGKAETGQAAPQPPAVTALQALPPSLLQGSLLPGLNPGQAHGTGPQGTAANEGSTSEPIQAPGANASEPEKVGKKDAGPTFLVTPESFTPPQHALQSTQIPYQPDAFRGDPNSFVPADPFSETMVYRGKRSVPVQRPLIELGRPLYTGGIYPPAGRWLGDTNLVMPHFMVYGDFRTGVGIHRNANGEINNLAFRANLDMDLEITATERLHAFMGPLDRGGDFTRFEFTDGVEFVDRTDLRLDNLFFEGDVGAIWGGLNGQGSPFDLPFTFGFLPVFYQNGIWANDNVIGAAFALPSKNSPLLNWANYDATFFWASDQINSDAFPADNNAAEFFGTAWFIEAYDGYIEADYAFVHDDVGGHRSYHNCSLAYTRRYFSRVSNSIRVITNFNQSLPPEQRTADGTLLLIENSLISKSPNTLVPYLNFFYGQGKTQSLARAAVAGGVLNNTGINFETDGLTGYPTLDATGVNTSGAAAGVNMLGSNFSHQLILEFAALAANGSQPFRNASGDQFAFGLRYQRPLSNAWLFRTDHMVGWLRGAEDIRGSRFELRWKF